MGATPKAFRNEVEEWSGSGTADVATRTEWGESPFIGVYYSIILYIYSISQLFDVCFEDSKTAEAILLTNGEEVIHSNFDGEKNEYFKNYLKQIYQSITAFRNLDALETAWCLYISVLQGITFIFLRKWGCFGYRFLLPSRVPISLRIRLKRLLNVWLCW